MFIGGKWLQQECLAQTNMQMTNYARTSHNRMPWKKEDNVCFLGKPSAGVTKGHLVSQRKEEKKKKKQQTAVALFPITSDGKSLG